MPSPRLRKTEPKMSTLLDFKIYALQSSIICTISLAFCTIILGSLAAPLSVVEESYFANKQNLFNLVFVKNGWGWTSLAFWYHLYASKKAAKFSAIFRWTLATVYWILITQWFFGPPIMDRLFILTGGVCRISDQYGQLDFKGHLTPEISLLLTSLECRNQQGHWEGGHDLSGHIFLLMHSSLLLIDQIQPQEKHVPIRFDRSEKLICGLLLLWWWMLLMTSLYFHSFFEKMTGFVAALFGWALLVMHLYIYKLLSMRLPASVRMATKPESQELTTPNSTLSNADRSVNSPELLS